MTEDEARRMLLAELAEHERRAAALRAVLRLDGPANAVRQAPIVPTELERARARATLDALGIARRRGHGQSTKRHG